MYIYTEIEKVGREEARRRRNEHISKEKINEFRAWCFVFQPLVKITTRTGLDTLNVISPFVLAVQSSHEVEMKS